ncbi:MATE efflux family protein [Tissierellia bacterium KA00581]|nr:MATE efflux family protein [Tissierellia bacterium KA00581]
MDGKNMNKKLIERLNKFAIPLLLQMITSYFIGATDVAIVSNISVESLNATSLVSNTLEMVAGVLGAITITLNILLGKSFGKKDDQKFSFEFYTSIFLSGIIGLFFSILIFLFGKNILMVLFDLDNKTLIQAMKYLQPMTFYVLLQLIIFAYTSTCKVLNKTKIILYISIFSSILDVTLDYIFVMGKFGMPKMGVEFVGYSTIFTMFISILLYSYFLREQIKFDLKCLSNYFKNTLNHFKLSIPLILQEIIDGSVYGLFVNMILVRLGTIDYAGYLIINTIIGLLFLFKYVYGSAVLSMISIESGALDKENMLKYPKYSSGLALTLYFIGGIFILIFNKNIVALFNDNKDVILIAKTYLSVFIAVNSISCISYSYKLGLQAINQSKFVLYTSIILNALAVLIMFITIIILRLSYMGLIFAIFISEVLTLIIFVNRYLYKIKN